MGKVLLLGGTGAIGRYTAAELAASGYEVYVTSRRRPASVHPQPGVTILQGDAMEDAFVRECARRLGSLDAIVDFMIYSTMRFTERRRMLLDLAGHYVFLSSARVHAASSGPITEDSPRLLDVSRDARYLRTDEYALAKARQEDLLLRSGRRNWTVVRPSLTFAAGRLQFGALEESTWLWRATRGLPVAVPDSVIDRFTTMTWAGDTGAILARLVRNPRAFGEIYLVASDESHTWREIGEIYSGVVDLAIDVVPERRYFAAMGATAQVRLARAVDRRFDASKVLDAVGGHSFAALRNGLTRELRATDLCDISPDIGKIAAIDRLTGTRSGLGRGVSMATAKYLVGRHPVLRSAVSLLRGVNNR